MEEARLERRECVDYLIDRYEAPSATRSIDQPADHVGGALRSLGTRFLVALNRSSALLATVGAIAGVASRKGDKFF